MYHTAHRGFGVNLKNVLSTIPGSGGGAPSFSRPQIIS